MTTESILGLPAIERHPLKLIDALGEGFPVKALPYFKRAARLSDSEFARLLGMGERDTAVSWIEEPQFALRGRRPRELLATEAGRQQVRSLLLRIEHAQLA